jgi:segregation and condensation protein B
MDAHSGEKTLEQIDALDDGPCPVSPDSIVEAILFTGAPEGVALTDRKIAAAMRDVSPAEVRRSVAELNRQYEDQDRAFRIVEEAGHFSLQLIDEVNEVQNYYYGRNRATRLSQNVIDVLAIVAYHQPISRKDVEKIRAKPSGAVLNQLVRRDLIAPEDSETAKVRQYRTTDRFLDLFGLQSIRDLPQTSVVSDLEELTDH